MSAVILKVNIKIVLYVAKVIEWMFEPNHVDVLKQKGISQVGNQLNTNHLGQHHGRKIAIPIPLGGLEWQVTKVLCNGERTTTTATVKPSKANISELKINTRAHTQSRSHTPIHPYTHTSICKTRTLLS